MLGQEVEGCRRRVWRPLARAAGHAVAIDDSDLGLAVVPVVLLARVPLGSLAKKRLPSTVWWIHAPFVRVTTYARDARSMRAPCTRLRAGRCRPTWRAPAGRPGSPRAAIFDAHNNHAA
eukprot:scaffold6976_cov69-Phaeocystis_antarctica.AAC.5